MDRVETLTFFFLLSILSYSTFFVCTLSLFYISPSFYFFIISFFFLRILFLSFSSSFSSFFIFVAKGAAGSERRKSGRRKRGGIRKKRGMQRLVVRHSVRGTVANNAFSLLLCASLVASKNFAEALLISLARKLRESVWRIFRNADPLARSTSMERD